MELNPSEWSFEDVGNTFHHEEEATPSPELLDRIRALFPYLEDRSADGDLASSGMSCFETIIKEGTSLCAAGHAVVTSSGMEFKKGRGRLSVVVGPSRHGLVRQLESWAWSYGVTAIVLMAIAIAEYNLQLHQYEIAWVLGGLVVLPFGLLLWMWGSI